ncbi:TlpA disulfide reductase family protein [Limnohabitans sp.]|uniref:TlpA family protein disulfide reductase n=1 Tax=Limnohabitans sp. TaxID=1907725 RepID=UPI00286F0EE9|nr:TlpA disulfide reductase family protein [Limnohabitans sp.]
MAALAGAAMAWKRNALQEIAPTAKEALWAAEFVTPSGESLHMSSLQGRPLVLNFWATWCPPCVEEMPLIDAFYRQNKQYGWQVVGLAIDQPSRVRQFLSQFPMSYTIGLAGLDGTELGKLLGNEQSSLPFTVVLDKEGRLKQRKLGKLTPEDIQNWVI